MGVSSNADAPALIDRALLDFRDMREVGGLIVRRECSHTKRSARFARSLAAGLIRIARDTHDLRRVALPDLVG